MARKFLYSERLDGKELRALCKGKLSEKKAKELAAKVQIELERMVDEGLKHLKNPNGVWGCNSFEDELEFIVTSNSKKAQSHSVLSLNNESTEKKGTELSVVPLVGEFPRPHSAALIQTHSWYVPKEWTSEFGIYQPGTIGAYLKNRAYDDFFYKIIIVLHR